MSPIHETSQASVQSWASTSGAYGVRVAISTLAKVALGTMLTSWLAHGPLTLWVLATSFGTVLSQIVDAGFQHLAVRASTVGLTTARERRAHALSLLRLIMMLGVGCTLLAVGLAIVAHQYWLRAYNLRTSEVCVVFGAAMIGAFIQLSGTTLAAYLIGSERPWSAILCTGAGIAGWALVAGLGAALNISFMITTISAQLPFVVVALFIWTLLGKESFGAQSRKPSVPLAHQRVLGPTTGRDLLPFMLFNLAGFIITGVDIYVVAALEPGLVAGYSYAIQATSLCVLVCTAIATPLVALSARRSTLVQPFLTIRPVVRATLVVELICALFIGLGCLWFRTASTIWLGSVGHDAAMVFAPLALAAAFRSTLLPALFAAVGSGHLKAFVRPALYEASCNAGASLVLGLRYGALGVATGSLVGSSIAILLFQNTVKQWRHDAVEGSSLVRIVVVGAVMLTGLSVATNSISSLTSRVAATVLLLVGVVVALMLYVRPRQIAIGQVNTA